MCYFFFFQAEDGIRDHAQSRGLGDVYKRQYQRRVHGGNLISQRQEAKMQSNNHNYFLIPYPSNTQYTNTSSVAETERKRLEEDSNVCVRIYLWFTVVLCILVGVIIRKAAGDTPTLMLWLIVLGPLVGYIVGLLILDFGLAQRNDVILKIAYWIILLSYIANVTPFLYVLLSAAIRAMRGETWDLAFQICIPVIVLSSFNTIIFLKAALQYGISYKVLRYLRESQEPPSYTLRV
eukprot:TRINITY_DN3509_c0_g2_i3.p1 TRINITY_DN3509_c0_g2~~TRINITY_DN3509_c0_g2_i3.p1  ORF type:complete len:235 (+),score=54.52 TRINITY_DN3509_c0_g2_i3:38-742(+)